MSKSGKASKGECCGMPIQNIEYERAKRLRRTKGSRRLTRTVIK